MEEHPNSAGGLPLWAAVLLGAFALATPLVLVFAVLGGDPPVEDAGEPAEHSPATDAVEGHDAPDGSPR